MSSILGIPDWCRRTPSGAAPHPRQSAYPIFNPDSDFYLFISIDHGTKFSAACYGIRKVARHNEPSELFEPDRWVSIGQASQRIPMEVGFGMNEGVFEMFIGAGLERARLSGKVDTCDIVEAVKLAIVFGGGHFDSEKLNDGIDLIEDNMESILRRLDFPRDVKLRLPYRSCTITDTIESPIDILYLSQLYLISLVKEDFRTRTGFSLAEVDFVFARKSIIAVSVPSCWSDRVIDRYSRLWDEAGLGSDTIFLSEAKSAAASAAYRSLRASTNKARILSTDADRARANRLNTTLSIVPDIGGATTDVAAISISVHGHLSKLHELVDSIGSTSGSVCLSQKLSSLLQRREYKKDRKAWQLASGLDEAEIFNAICTGFEKTKEYISPGESIEIWFQLPKRPGYRPYQTHNPNFCLKLGSETTTELFNEWYEEISPLVEGRIEAVRMTGVKFAFREIALAGGGSFSRHLRARFEQQYTATDGWSVIHVEDPNLSSVAEGGFLSLFDSDYRNQKFARASYGFSQTVKYDSKNSLHRKRRPDARTSSHYGKGKRLELLNTAAWKIQRGQELNKSVLSGAITISSDSSHYFYHGLVLEQKIIWTEDPHVGGTTDVFNVDEEESKGTIKSKILVLQLGSIVNAGLELKGDATTGYWTETDIRVYVKPRGLHIDFILVAPKGGLFPDDGDYSEPVPGEEPGYFRKKYSVYAKMAHAARLGDNDVEMTV